MADANGKMLSSSSPKFVSAGGKRAVTCSYPKSGQEQSFGNIGQGPWNDRPRGSAVTFTAGKSGQKQSA